VKIRPKGHLEVSHPEKLLITKWQRIAVVILADSSPFLKPQVGKKDTIEGCERMREVNA